MRAILALTLLLSCQAGVLMTDSKSQSEQAVISCMAENGVTKDDMKNSMSSELNPEDIKDNIKCTAQCYLLKLEMVDANGKLQLDNILAFAPKGTDKGKVEEALAACGNISSANPCDLGYRVSKCIGNTFKTLSN